ncbi:MAG TPA: sigma-70 family RNA polymerase sigma factor [Miltoncostaeaceae bacterium]|nr:sigma-70 family RNA polymerase sigma factor [Miltoncostaeaceae bacterium]
MPALSALAEADLAALAGRAQVGDRRALDDLVRAVADGIYNLAVRMLWHPEDAEDATQEILVKLVTRLDSFRGEAAFTTWAFRVAANHLLTTRKRRAERNLTFEAFAADLAQGLADPREHGPDEGLLEEEVKIGCTQGMLLCLDREHRLAYVLGEVFALDSGRAATITGITPAAFRKRLERARSRLAAFMDGNCGIVNPARPCRCRRRIDRAIERGRVAPEALLFATHPRADPAVRRAVVDMERLHAAAALFRSHPDYRAPAALMEGIVRLVRSGRYELLGDG